MRSTITAGPPSRKSNFKWNNVVLLVTIHEIWSGCIGHYGWSRDFIRGLQLHSLMDVLAKAAQEPSVPQDCDSTPEGKLFCPKKFYGFHSLEFHAHLSNNFVLVRTFIHFKSPQSELPKKVCQYLKFTKNIDPRYSGRKCMQF